MKRAVVTGGAGFIGSHLAEELVNRDYQVTILDNLSTGKMVNIDPLLQTGRSDFVHGSITDLPLLQKTFQGVEYIFHLAAVSSVPLSIQNPLSTNETNIEGTLNVLLAARDNGVKKVVYASSAAVYGDTPALPAKEETLPDPQSPYATTKLAGEYYCRVFCRIYGLPTVCLRFFNVYGPGQDAASQYASVIPAFITRVSQGDPPVIFGDGRQTRDFVFVQDVVRASILTAESNTTGVLNVGSGEGVSIVHLAKLITGLVGSRIDPVHMERRPGDIGHSLADIACLRAIGYDPRWSLERGLAETVKFFLRKSGYYPESSPRA